MKTKNIILSLILFLSFDVLSSEIDSFSIRDKVLGFPDSSSNLNQFFKKRLNDAVILANAWSDEQKCSKQYLERAVRPRHTLFHWRLLYNKVGLWGKRLFRNCRR